MCNLAYRPACDAELGDVHAEMLFANRRSRRVSALYGLFFVRPMIEGPSPVPRITGRFCHSPRTTTSAELGWWIFSM